MKGRFMVGVLVFWALVGCGRLEDKVYGQWKGQFESSVASQLGEQAGGFLGAFTLDLNKDHTYKLFMALPFEGTWKMTGRVLSFHQTKAMGQSTEQTEAMLKAMTPKDGKGKLPEGVMRPELTGTVSEDGREIDGTLTLAGSPLKVTFKKP